MQVLERLRPLALLLLRLGLGIIFVSHGYPKLFGHSQQWMGAFQHMGFPPYFAYISGILEFFGGLLLIADCSRRLRACYSPSKWRSQSGGCTCLKEVFLRFTTTSSLWR